MNHFIKFKILFQKNILPALFLLFVPICLLGQKQAYQWHFGDGRSFDFSSGTPAQTTGSLIQTFEGSASYSDSLGNLLFYTNGGGREPAFSGQDGGHIWNRNNGIMYDMQGTMGGGFSSRQSAVIFEAPGQSKVYYVFTMDEIEFSTGASPATIAAQPIGRGLRYFTVDMNLNGGLGSVVQADQPVYQPSAEGLCAIRHSNNVDYWILINQDSTGIGVYSVTSTGVSFLTNYTAVGPETGIIKASPDGSKVRTGTYLLNFNNSTGQLSNPVNLGSTSEFFEFSPNSRYVYELLSNPTSIDVRRYDLLAASIPSSLFNVFTINSAPAVIGGQMQLGPDGKIYFLELNFTSNTVALHRIECPNTNAPFVLLNIAFFNTYFVGLPNFPAWLFSNNDSTYVELGPDNVRLCDVGGSLTLNALNPGASYLWSTGATTQTITVNTPGTYSVTVTGTCGTGTDQIVVEACNTSSISCIEFFPTGSSQQWVVPAGVDSVRVKMWGAAGGGGPDSLNNAGGGGGYTEVSLPVAAGDFFEIVVGVGGQVAVGHNGGAGGYGGGGNGGSGNRIATIFGVPTNVGGAGGGGGASIVRLQGSINAIIGYSGGGGGATLNRNGGGGGGLIAEYTTANNSFNVNGFGGTQTAGGAASSNTICGHPVSGTAGAAQQGGTGATDLGGNADRTGGGGGGGGYFGGGGGGSHDGCFGVGSAGGGGSGFVCNTCPSLTGFTVTAGLAGVPANENDPLLTSYPGTATGVNNQTGGGGLVQICMIIACNATNDTIIVTECNSFTAPWGTVYTQSGFYSDTLAATNGCDSITNIDLTISGIITGPTFSISACNNYTAPWGTVYTQSGVYSDTLTAANGCDSIVTVDLTVTALVTPQFNSYGPFCLNAPIIQPLLPGTSQNGITGSWNPVWISTSVAGDIPYTFTPDPGQCATVYTMTVRINEPSTSTRDTTFCSSELPYLWNGQTINAAGTYTATLNNSTGCDSTVIIDIMIEANTPQVSIQGADSICLGQQETLIANIINASDYAWSTGATTPDIIINSAGFYSISASNACGTESASKTIALKTDCADLYDVFIPNAFSPNNDGFNDTWSVISLSNFSLFEVEIFDRWGNRIFRSRNKTDKWNGKYKGANCPIGSYVYHVMYQFPSQPVKKAKGNVLLLR